MDSYQGYYAEPTMDELERRYAKLNRQFYYLFTQGKISTSDPARITPEDIKTYVIWRKSEGVKDTSIGHDLAAVSNLCEYVNGNRCVTLCRSHYPNLFPRKRKKLLPIIEKDAFSVILEKANSLTEEDNHVTIRDFATVLLAIGGGLRTQEVQHAKIINLSDDLSVLYLDHVKGQNTYGVERTVPIRPECRDILRLWLNVRKTESEYLFASEVDGKVLCTNSLRKGIERVRKSVGIDFDFRKCRRTFAQYIVDEGELSMSELAVIMGHASVKTTETNYALPREDRVVKKLVEIWGE